LPSPLASGRICAAAKASKCFRWFSGPRSNGWVHVETRGKRTEREGAIDARVAVWSFVTCPQRTYRDRARRRKVHWCSVEKKRGSLHTSLVASRVITCQTVPDGLVSQMLAEHHGCRGLDRRAAIWR
jgi:hypothetical protein